MYVSLPGPAVDAASRTHMGWVGVHVEASSSRAKSPPTKGKVFTLTGGREPSTNYPGICDRKGKTRTVGS